MADERTNIEYNLTTKGVNQTAYDFTRVADAASQSGKMIVESSNQGALGAKGLGIAVKSLGHEFGVTGALSRVLGHEVSDVAVMLGSGATAFGVLGIAVMAAYKIYDHFTEAAKKKREELDKSVASLDSEVSALYRNAEENKKVTRANYDLLEVKRQLLVMDLEDKIERETEALSKQYDIVEKMATASRATVDEMGGLNVEDDPELIREKEKGKRRLAIQEENLLMQIALKDKYEKAVSYGNYSGEDEKAQKAKKKRDKEALKAFEDLQKERAKDIIGLKVYQDRVQEILARNSEAERKARVADYNDNISMLRRRTAAYEQSVEDEKRLNEARWESARMVSANIAQMADVMASIGGQNARKWFTLAKQAATAEALINTYQGATKALAQGGFWGIAMAATVTALGLANVAKIQSQNFSGGAGVGGGSIGTFSANPVTGLPAQPAPTPQTKVINIYVQGHLLDNDGLMRITADADNRAEADNVYTY